LVVNVKCFSKGALGFFLFEDDIALEELPYGRKAGNLPVFQNLELVYFTQSS